MDPLTEFAFAGVIFLAIVGALVIAAISALKPNDHAAVTDRWENGVLIRETKQQATAPVVVFVQMFLAIAIAGVVMIVIINFG